MKLRKFAATSALVIAALGISTGTAFAAPAPAANPDIHYTANVVDKSVVVKTDAGSLTTEGNEFQVRDNQGKVVAGFPLSYQHDGLEYPIAAQIDGNQATLVPSTDRAAAHPAQMLHDVASRSDLDAANQSAINELGIATSIGTLVGTAIGLAGGCVLGAVLGTPFLVVPGWIGGCLTGAALGAPLGAAAGLVGVGGISGVLVAIEYFNRINAPAES
ncbi:hypothetical protein A5780_37215 [Nocardia sp. 852002-20019_SCH5090214]|jgi:hypothetical protein|uniref:DUF8020 domain-containing protein n=1 Tax=Nocardia nova TaxID=37330 RepID=A0A2S6A479_9NOCA|nr:hypothetical protein [Nocardia sp. 852002-20019_SCH5090214]MBF6274085.1 hypothetical protein [Nocardia nova]OBA46417.1 hypothetical protein A5789_04630 [Nocardia sp. 852002-51101_SCH5132738]OBB39095.1 hypothetical protein A5748_35470 [Nocardia sp. 852002-51244_SCH5132740]OBF83240.1 hypothetical protein A9X06_02290 [Mycobacterium sp. 852002-51759_SCH5129042]OBA44588.1 hypothetical protein A5780_37215 [Nocardia sp. 852002-20019_SCH5090214]